MSLFLSLFFRGHQSESSVLCPPTTLRFSSTSSKTSFIQVLFSLFQGLFSGSSIHSIYEQFIEVVLQIAASNLNHIAEGTCHKREPF